MATQVNDFLISETEERWALKFNILVWLERLQLCLERRRQRQALLRLDQRMLKDIGISRADAEGEAAKPCWKQ